MANGKLFSPLKLKKNYYETAFKVLTERALALGPNLISWQCSAMVVIFPTALSRSEAAKLLNLNLQARKFDI